MAEAEPVNNEPKVVETKLSEDLTKKIVQMCERLHKEEGEEKEMAIEMRKEMETTYGTNWHCIVGRNFGR